METERVQKTYVNQIADRDSVESVFLLREKIQAVAKNGKPYLVLKLMDKTGELEGRVWDNADKMSTMAGRDDFVLVRGRASLYLGKMQLVVQEMVRQAESEVNLADFLPVSKYPVEELLARLHQKVKSLSIDHFRRLMESFLGDPEFLRRYSTAPAAKSMHHVFLGGLLEHSLAVADLAEDVCQRYPDLQRDLLIVGALLHDVGKIAELDYRRSFDYTDAGKLIGHIVLGAQMVETKIREIGDFPAQDALLLGHLLLSHHGQYEYGSPKRPKTVEAVILNFLDDLDSKINGVQAHIDRDAVGESAWTSYHRLYDRYFFKGEISVQEDSVASVSVSAPEPDHATSPRPRREGPLGVSLGDRLKGEIERLSLTPGDKGQK
jgi:3'-5' exoribonuclease